MTYSDDDYYDQLLVFAGLELENSASPQLQTLQEIQSQPPFFILPFNK